MIFYFIFVVIDLNLQMSCVCVCEQGFSCIKRISVSVSTHFYSFTCQHCLVICQVTEQKTLFIHIADLLLKRMAFPQSSVHDVSHLAAYSVLRFNSEALSPVIIFQLKVFTCGSRLDVTILIFPCWSNSIIYNI